MVGAVVLVRTPVKIFPDWYALGNIFYKKLHGREPSNAEALYLNALRLADEVGSGIWACCIGPVSSHKRPRSSLRAPRSFIEQSYNFLGLMFLRQITTRLLERASESAMQRYDIVVNHEDLSYSQRPRIIKLHTAASHPNRPFVITEEGLQAIPHKKNAPFVNTVQQSLLENTLCLVGFSGTDPNFLKWIGWIRDNFGE